MYNCINIPLNKMWLYSKPKLKSETQALPGLLAFITLLACNVALLLDPNLTPQANALYLHFSYTIKKWYLKLVFTAVTKLKCIFSFSLARGRPIYVQYDGSFVRAFDSSFSAGVFHLESGDELRIELDDFSRNCRVIPHVDRSFFGAFRLHASSFYAYDVDDNTWSIYW